MDTTRVTLIQKVGDPNDQQAWAEFYRLYWEPILGFARKKGMDEHAAYDVLQETMVLLMSLLRDFQYDPKVGRFRNYVYTITFRVILKHQRRAYRKREISMHAPLGDENLTMEDILVNPEEGEGPLFDDYADWLAGILDKMLEDLSHTPNMKPENIEIFRLVKLKNEDPQSVADRHGLSRNAVDQIIYRIKIRLKEKLQDYPENLLD